MSKTLALCALALGVAAATSYGTAGALPFLRTGIIVLSLIVTLAFPLVCLARAIRESAA